MGNTLIQHGMTVLLLCGWIGITAGAGRFFLSKTGLRPSSLGEALFLSAGIGIPVVGYAIFLLGVANALHPSSLYLTLFSLSLLSAVGCSRPLGILPAPASGKRGTERTASAALGILLLCGFMMALTPEIGKDALIYHLAVPKRYLLQNGFHFIPGNVFSTYPLLGEMHYLIALFLHNDLLAKAMNFSMLAGILFGMCLFIRIFMRGQSYPVLSMLIFLSIPSVFAASHMAYNDLFVAFFTLAAVYAFLHWSEDQNGTWLLLCGLFSGSAAACKYTALLLTPIGCLGILVVASRIDMTEGRAIRLLFRYIATAFVCGSPFYIRNTITTGNPFHPFLYGIFGGRGWDMDQARLYDIFIQNLGMGRDWPDYLLLPWNLSFHAKMDSPEFDGILGPIFLLTLPILLFHRRWQKPVRVILAFSLLTFLFWAFSAQQIRYLIPLFPLLAIVTGATLSHLRDRKYGFALMAFIVTGCLIFNGYHISRQFLKVQPLRVAVGVESRDNFLNRTLSPYRMYRFANDHLHSDARVFLIFMKNYTYLCNHSCYSDSMFEAHTLQKILSEESSASGVRTLLKDMGFTHLMYDAIFLLGDPSPLSQEQKILFESFQRQYLRPVHHDGPYRLDLISET